MPTYVYAVINEDGTDGETFEIVQRMSEPALKKHPKTGQPVRRVIMPPSINTSTPSKKRLDPDYQAKHGFTRYEKSGDGTYEKTAGDGPDLIKRD